MATIKTYTDIEQSKKLAEFLPIESADMFYWCADHYPKEDWIIEVGELDDNYECICAWSLAALLGVLPVMIDYKGSIIRLRMDKGNVGQDDYAIWYDDLDNGLSTNIASEAKNFIDACYEMIIKLHEQNIL